MAPLVNQRDAQNSLIDFILDSIPELQFITIKHKKAPSPSERSLFSLWSDAENQLSSKKFLRPLSMDDETIAQLQTAGLIELTGKEIKVTAKGANVIQKIILSEEQSVFDKSASGDNLVKTASRQRTERDVTWYQRLKN